MSEKGNKQNQRNRNYNTGKNFRKDSYKGKTSRPTQVDEPDAKLEQAMVRYKKTSGGVNDVAWYTKSDALVKAAASVSMYTPTGYPFNLYSATQYPTNVTSKQITTPGVMALQCSPGVGNAATASDPLNTAAQAIYTWVRHANSGSSNYDPTDLMQYIIAVASAIQFHNYMQRAYGVAKLYSQENAYLPHALLRAMGLIPSDIQSHLADFNFYINVFAEKINARMVPANFTYFLKQAWLYSNIYTDASSGKAQFYLFNPDFFYVYNETSGSTPAFLKATEFQYRPTGTSAGLGTVEGLIKYGDALLAPLFGSESFGIMSGDIRKAYGNAVFKVGATPIDYTVEPVHNTTVLAQIHNAQLQGEPFLGNFNITQNLENAVVGPFLQTKPTFTTACPGYRHDILFDLYWENVTPEDVLEATRFAPYALTESSVATATPGNVAYWRHQLDTASDVTISKAIAFTADWNSSTLVKQDVYYGVTAITTDPNAPTNSVDVWDPAVVGSKLAVLNTFDWHPGVYLMTADATNVTSIADMGLSFSGVFMDLDNYTMIGLQPIRNMNQTALLSLFDTPNMTD